MYGKYSQTYYFPTCNADEQGDQGQRTDTALKLGDWVKIFYRTSTIPFVGLSIAFDTQQRL